LIGDDRSGEWHAPFAVAWTSSSPELDIVANGAGAMQTASCGHRAEIFGSFRENLAMGRPNMRLRPPHPWPVPRKFRDMAL